MTSINILLIEDNLAEARLIAEILKDAKDTCFSLIHTQRLQGAIALLAQQTVDVILLDLTLPDSQGLASLVPLKQQAPSTPIVVLTNTNDDKLAIAAVRQGAQDYLVKRQVKLEPLVRSLHYAIERKQSEENLRKSNQNLTIQVQKQLAELSKAQELNQLRSELVSMISHDLRNPLTTILLSTGLLEEHEKKLTNAQKIRQYQRIRAAIQNVTGLLDEILWIGKAESGKLECELKPLALQPFCSELLETLQLEDKSNHSLKLVTQGELNNGLWDEKLLQHILYNLISNAIKYSPEGGVVTLKLQRQGTNLQLSVEDSGIGISKADLVTLFEPFHRGDNVENIPGTGLGLAIVKSCVDTHGGTIKVTSQLGVGTNFQIILPFQEL